MNINKHTDNFQKKCRKSRLSDEFIIKINEILGYKFRVVNCKFKKKGHPYTRGMGTQFSYGQKEGSCYREGTIILTPRALMAVLFHPDLAGNAVGQHVFIIAGPLTDGP